MLNTLVFSQTTNIDKIARRNFLGSQVLAILNLTLLDNLLIYSQLNAKTLWAYLWTLIEISSLATIFANY